MDCVKGFLIYRMTKSKKYIWSACINVTTGITKKSHQSLDDVAEFRRYTVETTRGIFFASE